MSLFPGPPTTSPPPLPGEAPRRQACPSGHLSLAAWGCSLRPWPAPRATLGARELQAAAQLPDSQWGPALSGSPPGRAPVPAPGPPEPHLLGHFLWHVWSPSPSLPTPWIVRKFLPRVGELGRCPELPTPPRACRPCWWEGTHQPKGLAQILRLEGDGGSPGAPCCERGVGVSMGPLWRQAHPGPASSAPSCPAGWCPGHSVLLPPPLSPLLTYWGPHLITHESFSVNPIFEEAGAGRGRGDCPGRMERASAQSCPRPEANW